MPAGRQAVVRQHGSCLPSTSTNLVSGVDAEREVALGAHLHADGGSYSGVTWETW